MESKKGAPLVERSGEAALLAREGQPNRGGRLEEYEQGSSFEARLVRQVDRLEMGPQATVYGHQGAGDLSQFFASVHKVPETPELQALLAELETPRPAR